MLKDRERFPLVRKLKAKVDPPTLADTRSDLERLSEQLRKELDRKGEKYLSLDLPIEIDLRELRKLGSLLRRNNWEVTVSLADMGSSLLIFRLEGEEASEENLGLAVDIGTTTVVASLMDLRKGHLLERQTSYNGQIEFGPDVTSRMIHAEKAGGLAELNRAIISTLNGMISKLSQSAGVDKNDISCALFAGNTIMLHLLVSLNPFSIRREPYVPVTTSLPLIRARELGIDMYPGAPLRLPPAASGYIGADITADILATGLRESDLLTLLIDIGTNGETVLGSRDWVIACSGSAGSAFEGCGLEFGMSATPGAIEKVAVDEKGGISYRTVGDVPAEGICGSGLIDALAGFLMAGIINQAGKIHLDVSLPWVRRGEYRAEIVIARAGETKIGKDIVLTQANIDNLIRDKAALYAGSSILLRKMGLEFNDVDRIIVAGGFGEHLDIDKAVSIGLLLDVPREKIEFICNSCIAGAELALMSREARAKAEEIAKFITCLELTAEPDYMAEYMAALFLPHTDLSRFPSFLR